VASKVAAVLRIQLAERESRSLRRPPTTNAEAYDAYLRAHVRGGERAEMNRTEIDSAIVALKHAVALDSTFASAWAELARSDISSVFLFDADSRRLDESDAAIRRAIALDSSNALAWKARSDLEWNAVRGWHFPEALADVRHALALRPSLVSAHNALSSLYFHYGFMEQARRALEASLSLDPRDGCDNPTTCQGFSRPRVARVLWYEQKFDSALAVYDRIPFLGGFVWEKAVVFNALGRPAEGLAALDSTKQGSGRESSDREAARALLYASMGRSGDALSHLTLAMGAPDSRSHFHHAQFTIACTYARLGRKRDAVEWLRRTANNGMPNYPLFRNDPNLRGLQGDPEYENLMTDLRRQFDANARLVATEATPTNNR
jgi:tetratricopeptide (TPR) repeat protein